MTVFSLYSNMKIRTSVRKISNRVFQLACSVATFLENDHVLQVDMVVFRAQCNCRKSVVAHQNSYFIFFIERKMKDVTVNCHGCSF